MTAPRDLIGDLLRAGARRDPNRLFLSMGADRRTYRQVDDAATRIANALLGTGLQRHDRLAIWADDSVDYLVVYLAAARAGFIVVPINARLTAREASSILEDSGAGAVAFSASVAPVVDEVLSSGDLRALVGLGGAELPGSEPVESLVEAGSTVDPPAPDEDDGLVIAYTSGTTGRPKGALLTHRSIKNLARTHAVAYRLPAGSIGAYTGSMSFPATVLAFAMSHLYVGGTVHVLGRWDLTRALDLVETERANWMYVPSPAVRDLADALQARPAALEALATVLHSASKVPPEQLAALVDVIGPRLVEGWGLTENSGGLVTATTAADFDQPSARDLLASVGRPTVDSEVRVLDPDGQDVACDGTVGELVIRTSSLMDRYWKQPEATQGVLRDGWYWTGDIGSRDDAGYVYIADRRSDLIVTGGINVYPSEVEQVIVQVPGVTGCAVVGLPDDRWGQTVTAVVETDRPVDPALILEQVRANLASFKKPTSIEFVESLPRTVSDKVRRQEVRDRLLRARQDG